MGAIQDRTREHLGQADKAIVEYRRLLLNEIEQGQGGGKPMLFLNAADARAFRARPRWMASARRAGWEAYWMEVDVKRGAARRGRRRSPRPPTEIADKVATSKAVDDGASAGAGRRA